MSDGPVNLRTDQPHSARMYDYYLGGKDNYEVDRAAAEEVKKVWPSVALAARANRQFMQRATHYLAAQGIRQFLDIGTGIPTSPNLHEVAQSIAPESRVVYVDNDPIVLAHARALLVSTAEGRTAYIDADINRPATILESARKTLDLSEPVALSLIAVLPFVPGEGVYGIVDQLVAALAPGSFLSLTYMTADFDPEGVLATVRIYQDGGIGVQPRDQADVQRFFDGLELLEPGVVPIHRWRPDGIEPPKSADQKIPAYAGVARKP